MTFLSVEDNRYFSKLIKEKRLELGFSKLDFAKYCGVTWHSINKIETLNPLSILTIVKICKALDIDWELKLWDYLSGVRFERLKKGISIPELSQKTGIPIKRIIEIENFHSVSRKSIKKISEALGVDPEDLI